MVWILPLEPLIVMLLGIHEMMYTDTGTGVFAG